MFGDRSTFVLKLFCVVSRSTRFPSCSRQSWSMEAPETTRNIVPHVSLKRLRDVRDSVFSSPRLRHGEMGSDSILVASIFGIRPSMLIVNNRQVARALETSPTTGRKVLVTSAIMVMWHLTRAIVTL